MNVPVYRVEHRKTGFGPYYITEHRCGAIARHLSSDLSNHPMPDEDGLGRVESCELCGFRSIAQMQLWFKGAFYDIKLFNRVIRRYLVPKEYVRYGRHQVVFNKYYAGEGKVERKVLDQLIQADQPIRKRG